MKEKNIIKKGQNQPLSSTEKEKERKTSTNMVLNGGLPRGVEDQ